MTGTSTPHPRYFPPGAAGRWSSRAEAPARQSCWAIYVTKSPAALWGWQRVPLLLRARDLTLAEDRDLIEHLVSMLRYQYEMDVTPRTLDILLEQGELLIAVDGLDEIADPAARNRLLAQVNTLCVKHPSAMYYIRSFQGTGSSLRR